jgi:hypothetical protein
MILEAGGEALMVQSVVLSELHLLALKALNERFPERFFGYPEHEISDDFRSCRFCVFWIDALEP